MASVIITSLTPSPGTLSNIPVGQDTTLSVVASASWLTATYSYTWRKDGTSITGATNSSYQFDALTENFGTYTVVVSALSSTSTGIEPQASVVSGQIVLSAVIEDPVKPFEVYDVGPESGRERHRRLRHLGYI